MDGRMDNLSRSKPSWEHVQAFFLQCYECLAEPLAEGEPEPDAMLVDQEGRELKDDFSQWVLSSSTFEPAMSGAQGSESREQRWLNPCSLAELFEQYKFQNAKTETASFSVFYACYKENWRGVLRIRQRGQHARCSDCAKLSKMRQQAVTEEQKYQVQQMFQDHIGGIFADRNVAQRYMSLSEASTKQGTTLHPSAALLYLSLDGMDQVGSASINAGLWVGGRFGCVQEVAHTCL